MPRGGKRPGAGRKKKPATIAREQLRSANSIAEARIAGRLDALFTSLFALADGVHEERELPSGKTVVYTTPPDRAACIYLVDRIMGKPTERHEHDFSHLSDEELLARITGSLDGTDEAGDEPPRPALPALPR